MNNFVVAASLIAAIIIPIITQITRWLVPNYFGRNLLRFWDLKAEACKALSISDKSQIRELAIEMDAFWQSLPKPIAWYLFLSGYRLREATQAFTELSKSMGGDSHSETVSFRVRAQKALRLHIKPSELKLAQAYGRLLTHAYSGRSGTSGLAHRLLSRSSR